jgi:hypothetical protein
MMADEAEATAKTTIGMYRECYGDRLWVLHLFGASYSPHALPGSWISSYLLRSIQGIGCSPLTLCASTRLAADKNISRNDKRKTLKEARITVEHLFSTDKVCMYQSCVFMFLVAPQLTLLNLQAHHL